MTKLDEAQSEVTIGALAGEVASALNEKSRFAGLFAVPDQRALRLVAVLAGPGPLGVISASLDAESVAYPSVTSVVPSADWYEREIHDLYGVVPLGHPDLDPLVLPRREGSPAPRPGSEVLMSPIVPSPHPLQRLVEGEGTFTIPYGPVRSGVFEAVEYVVETPGEDIPRVRARVHYKHRGVESVFDGRSTADGVLIAERVEGVAGVAHALAYCQALEHIAGVEVPPAAQFVRVLHAELERVANHLDSTIRHSEAAGQAVAYARLSAHKEAVMRLRALLCGSRFSRGVVVPGGVAAWPYLGPEDVRGAVAAIEHDIGADVKLLMSTPSFLDRLRGTGVIPPAVAATHGALGPLGRGSGLAEDVRLDRSYGGYRHLGFEPAMRDEGDALARQLVRNEEISASFHLVRQVLDELGRAGSEMLSTPLGEVTGEAIGWSEAPQGEVLYLVRVEDGFLTRVKARSASFHNLGLFTAAFPKDITTDFAFIEASFGLSIAGVAG